MSELPVHQVALVPAVSRAHSYPGRPEQAGAVRRFLSEMLQSNPRLEDAVLCVSELAANAILHSKSGLPGGQFEVRVRLHSVGGVRIEVTDQGGPWVPDPDGRQNHGRGLLIVSRLANYWGIVGDGQTGRTAWFELLSALDPANSVSSGQERL
jgi:serine/threonine-protein kinase RsbW